MPGKLPKVLVDRVESGIDRLFQRIKDRFLGPLAGPKRLIVGYNRDLSLPGIYAGAHINERSTPDQETLNGLIRVADNYLEAEKAKAKAKAVNAVQAFTANQAYYDQDPAGIQTTLLDTLSDVFGEAKRNVARIVDSETQRAKNTGTLEGVVRANSAMGVEDPSVMFIVVRDGVLCKECIRLHLMPDKVTPRLWYLSEVEHGYHVHGEDHPSIAGEHPNCRCVLSTLLPGFGFRGAEITWVGTDHLEIETQRGIT